MTTYDNSGALFKNDKEGGNPNWPDYKGSLTVAGNDYWVSAWIKDGPKGKFMSLSVKPKEAKQTIKAPERQREPGDDDDEIPF